MRLPSPSSPPAPPHPPPHPPTAGALVAADTDYKAALEVACDSAEREDASYALVDLKAPWAMLEQQQAAWVARREPAEVHR